VNTNSINTKLAAMKKDDKLSPADIRRQNLKRWLETNPVPAKERSYFSQLVNSPISFGEKAARRIENDYGMEAGYLDRFSPDYDVVISNPMGRADDNSVEVPHFREVVGSMGRGVVLRDQPGEIITMKVTPEWLKKNVPHHSSSNNLCVVTGFGDSMKGMFNSGDPLLIDTGIKVCDHDGVFFFRVGDEGFIKRLQRIPGEGIRVISENKHYESWTIKPDMDFQVFGKVLKVWESTDF
jgi:phage repressor protein C with HTH and peptisase S24 domain